MMFGAFGFGLILIIGIVVYFSRSIAPGLTGNEKEKKSALDILEQRFAKGEIDLIEFKEKKGVILGEDDE